MKYRSRRKPADFDAILSAESGDHPVKLRNVAMDGVQVTGLAGGVFADTDVKLVVRNRRMSARVCWVDEDRAGVRLKVPMSRDMLALISHGTRGAKKHRFQP